MAHKAKPMELTGKDQNEPSLANFKAILCGSKKTERKRGSRKKREGEEVRKRQSVKEINSEHKRQREGNREY